MADDKINIAQIGLWQNGAAMWIQSSKFVHVSVISDEDGWLKVYINGKAIAGMDLASGSAGKSILTEQGVSILNQGMSSEQLQAWSVKQKSKVGDGTLRNSAS